MRWIGHGQRTRRLHEYDGERQLTLARVACSACGKTLTLFPPEVIPRFCYSRSVIEAALRSRSTGASWEKCAVTCTADGLVSTAVVWRWADRFPASLPPPPPVALFARQSDACTLSEPAESRVPDPTQEDPWARSPPRQP